MAAWDRLREHVFKRDGYTCLNCGLSATAAVRGKSAHVSYQTPEPGNPLSLDHVVPRSQGGIDHVGNLQTLCLRCNMSKGGRFEWLEPSDPEAQFPPEGYQ